MYSLCDISEIEARIRRRWDAAWERVSLGQFEAARIEAVCALVDSRACGSADLSRGSMLWLGRVYRDGGSPEKAAPVFEHLLAVSYRPDVVAVDLASAYGAQGEWQAAYELAVDVFSRSASGSKERLSSAVVVAFAVAHSSDIQKERAVEPLEVLLAGSGRWRALGWWGRGLCESSPLALRQAVGAFADLGLVRDASVCALDLAIVCLIRGWQDPARRALGSALSLLTQDTARTASVRRAVILVSRALAAPEFDEVAVREIRAIVSART